MKKNHKKILFGSISFVCIFFLLGISSTLEAESISLMKKSDQLYPDITIYRGFVWGRVNDTRYYTYLDRLHVNFFAVNVFFFGTVSNSNSINSKLIFQRLDNRYYTYMYRLEFKGICTQRFLFGIYPIF